MPVDRRLVHPSGWRAVRVKLERCVDDAVDRRGHTIRRAELHHSTGQPRQLQLVACEQIDAHRRHQIGWGTADHRTRGIEHVRRELYAAGAADIDRLLHRVIDQRRNVGIIAQIADGPTRERTRAADRHHRDELLPTVALDVAGWNCLDSGGPADVADALDARRDLSIELAKDDPMVRAALADDTWGDDRTAHPRDANQHVCGTENW